MKKVIILKTSQTLYSKSTGEMFFLQLLLDRYFESAQVDAGSSTPQEAAKPMIYSIMEYGSTPYVGMVTLTVLQMMTGMPHKGL